MRERASATRTTLLGFMALAAALGIGRFAFTPLLPMMRAEGLLGVGGGGWLATIHFLGYAMGALLARYLAASPRPMLFASLAAIALATLVMGLTSSFPLWILSRWSAGVCSAFVLVFVSNYVVRRLAQARRPDLQGLLFAGVGTGIALVGLLTLALSALRMPSWSGWILCGLVSLAVAVLVVREWPETGGHTPEPSPDHPPGAARLEWRLILPYGAMGLGYVIPATYLPVMAQAAVPSPLAFGWTWPVFGAAAVLSTVVASRVARRLSDRSIWLVSQLVMAGGLLLPALWPHLASVIVAGVCVGGTFMVITMVGIKEAHRVGGARDATPQIAATTAAFAIGQMVGPAIAGVIYDASGGFAYPLMMASGCLALTASLLLAIADVQRLRSFCDRTSAAR